MAAERLLESHFRLGNLWVLLEIIRRLPQTRLLGSFDARLYITGGAAYAALIEHSV